MKKKVLAVAAVLSLAMTACGNSGTAETNTSGSANASGSAAASATKATIWMYPVIADEAKSKAFWTEQEAAFEKANPNIDLAIELQPWAGRDEKVATAIASGKGPDLVLLTPDSLPGYVANKGLKSLKGAQDSAFLPAAVEAATVDGEVYAVPMYQTVITPAFNKKVYADAGVTELPKTWDEMKAAAPKLAANGVAAMDYGGKSTVTLNMTFYPLLWQAGGSVFSEDGKTVAFNSPEGQEALQFLVDMQKMKALPPDAATKDIPVEGSDLATGKTGMTMTASKADVKALEKAVGAENVEVTLPLKNKEQKTFGLPGLLVRTSISKDDATANTVAKYFSSKDFQESLSKESGYFPARTDAKADPSDPLNAKFQESLEFARAGEVNPKSRQVMASLSTYIQAALNGGQSVDEALAAAEKECNELLKG